MESELKSLIDLKRFKRNLKDVKIDYIELQNMQRVTWRFYELKKKTFSGFVVVPIFVLIINVS